MNLAKLIAASAQLQGVPLRDWYRHVRDAIEADEEEAKASGND